MKRFIQELKDRDILSNATSENIANNSTAYAGFDPTARSLTLGNLAIVATLKRWQQHGGKVVILIGNNTASIGDPSGKNKERELLDYADIAINTEAIAKQISSLLPNATIVYQDDMDVTDFMRIVGKHMSINEMLKLDSVKSRLTTGISLTEFCYQAFQAYDFYKLFVERGVTVQLGGSDQWGNICVGIDLIRKITGKQSHGVTTKLLLKADGTKFGKSESGTIWLDSTMTTPFEFYQYLINTPDEMTLELYKMFSMLYLSQIQELDRHLTAQQLKQNIATELCNWVHKGQVRDVVKVSELVFSKGFKNCSDSDFDLIKQHLRIVYTHTVDPLNLPITELISTGYITSKSDLQRKGFKVEFRGEDALLTIGKKNKCLLVRR